MFLFFFKQKTAYEIYQCDWSSDVCSSDLDIWYDGKQWVGSHFVIDGEELTYELVSNERQYAALAEYLD